MPTYYYIDVASSAAAGQGPEPPYDELKGDILGPKWSAHKPKGGLKLIAEGCAKHHFNAALRCLDSRAYAWPREYIIYAADKTTRLGRCTVDIEHAPSFTAVKIDGEQECSQ